MDKKFQVDSLLDTHSSHQRKKAKFLNFIKFSQNGHKESALTEKRAKKECSCHRMLKFGFRNHKTL